MPEASDVYRKGFFNGEFDSAGVAHFLNHGIFCKHANPLGLKKALIEWCRRHQMFIERRETTNHSTPQESHILWIKVFSINMQTLWVWEVSPEVLLLPKEGNSLPKQEDSFPVRVLHLPKQENKLPKQENTFLEQENIFLVTVLLLPTQENKLPESENKMRLLHAMFPD